MMHPVPASVDVFRSSRRLRWLPERELVVLVLVVSAVYFSRLTTLTIRGEESRRARVACEMLESGDWIVPRQQGQLYFSRPPLGSWPIALFGELRGTVDAVAIRVPTVLATLLTTVLIYLYARRVLTPHGALAAGLAFATMGQVLELGRLAETEATFTLLIASSLLIWHWGHEAKWRPHLVWIAGYTLAALAGLAKGPQGPVYFVAPVFSYLVVTGQWRTLLRRDHAAGLAAFALVVSAWQIPYYLATDAVSVYKIWFRLAADRFVDNRPTVLANHLFSYPLEVLGCMLPWSALLSGFMVPSFRRSLGEARPYVIFLTTAIVVTFPSVWLATGARGRYFMPLYPCCAVLIGLVIDRCLAASVPAAWRLGWRLYIGSMAAVVLVAGLCVALASFGAAGGLAQLAQPGRFAAVYLLAALVTAAFLVRSMLDRATQIARWAPLALACFVGLSYTGAVINARVRVSQDTRANVVRLKQRLPGERLVSLGRVDHLFAYYYGDKIGALPLRRAAEKMPEDVSYFCFDAEPGKAQPKIPFAWEQVDVVSLDRNKTSRPERLVIVGRRLDGPRPVTAMATSITSRR